MINPVTGAIAKVTTASPDHDHSGNITVAPASAIMETTVTAAVVDEAGQEDSTTELQKSTICPSSPVNVMCMQICV